jgi:uncharacterized glyoxalase superfamily protein PhnB
MATKKKASRPRRAASAKARAAAKRPAPRRTAARRRRLSPRRQPESLRLRSAGPSFTVNDLQKSIGFYRDVLGFVEKERWEQDGVLRGIELVAGRVSVWLSQDDWQKGRDRVKGQGFRLYCDTAQDVDTLAAQIKARGGRLAEEPKDQPWGGRAFSVVDPDGFALTIASE